MKRLSNTDQNSRTLTNVPTPTNGGDAVNKTYADGVGTNKMTTNTTQTITSAGAKTFEASALIMTSASGTGEPYSDANPPLTLNMSDQSTSPTTPPTGQSTLYTTNGKNLNLKDQDGTEIAFATRAEAVIRVNHGATAGTARPAGATYIEWFGSVTPTNAISGDTWIDTA